MHAYSPQKCIWTRPCVPMQRCRSFFAVEVIANLSRVLREHHTGCRLPPALLPARQNQSPDAVCSGNPSKSTLAHDVVAAAVLHKHHPIIRVGADLIQFVCRLHSRLATEATRIKNIFSRVIESETHRETDFEPRKEGREEWKRALAFLQDCSFKVVKFQGSCIISCVRVCTYTKGCKLYRNTQIQL